jgi:hypothetical protein
MLGNGSRVRLAPPGDEQTANSLGRQARHMEARPTSFFRTFRTFRTVRFTGSRLCGLLGGKRIMKTEPLDRNNPDPERAQLEVLNVSTASFDSLGADSYGKHTAKRSLDKLKTLFSTLLKPGEAYDKIRKMCPRWGTARGYDSPNRARRFTIYDLRCRGLAMAKRCSCGLCNSRFNPATEKGGRCLTTKYSKHTKALHGGNYRAPHGVSYITCRRSASPGFFARA